MPNETVPMPPTFDDPDQWHRYLSHYLDNRAMQPVGLEVVALRVGDAIRAAYRRGYDRFEEEMR